MEVSESDFFSFVTSRLSRLRCVRLTWHFLNILDTVSHKERLCGIRIELRIVLSPNSKRQFLELVVRTILPVYYSAVASAHVV